MISFTVGAGGSAGDGNWGIGGAGAPGRIVITYTGGATTYTISGTVLLSGSPLADVSVVVTDDDDGDEVLASTTTGGAGTYNFTLEEGTNVTVTASKAGFSFAPESYQYGNLGANQTNQNFAATDLNASYDISGKISLTSGAGISPPVAPDGMEVYAVANTTDSFDDRIGLGVVDGPPPGSYDFDFSFLIPSGHSGEVYIKVRRPGDNQIDGIPIKEILVDNSDYDAISDGVDQALVIPEPGTHNNVDFFIELDLPPPGVIFVNLDFTGTPSNGTMWSRAYNNLPDALNKLEDEAPTYNQIWMTGGDYTTSSTFEIPADVVIVGGFAGYEGDPVDREGDATWILGDGLSGSVFSSTGHDFGLDGIVISGGDATLGGGVYLANGTLSLDDVTFYANMASSAGGGVYLVNAELDAESVSFLSNTARSYGGAIHINRSTAIVRNTIFDDNVVTRDGGAVYHERSDGTYLNCTFHANDAGSRGKGGGFSNDRYSTGTFRNTIFWANSARRGPQLDSVRVSALDLENCTVGGGFSSGTNISTVDPGFDEDLRPESAAVTFGVSVEPYDRTGLPRTDNSIGAMIPGAQE